MGVEFLLLTTRRSGCNYLEGKVAMYDSVRSASRMLAIGLLVLATTAVCLAAESFPYVGVVAGDSVYVRSGDSTNCYPVMKVSKGQRLTVQGESAGWLKIAPPTGTFSWVDKSYVERAGDQGTITADRVWVRAGSALSNERSAAQCVLNKGDKVTVLGEEETFLKIQTPANASLYIATRFVTPEGQAGALAAATSQPGAAGSQPVGSSVTANATGTPGIITRSAAAQKPRSTGAAGATARHATTTESPSTGDAQQQFDALEADLKLELAKPLGERNFDTLSAKYKALSEQTDDEAIQAAARYRVKDLSNIGNFQGSADAVARADAMFKNELAIWNRPRPAASQSDPKRGWDAKGVLKPSWVFTGNNTAKLYRLVDPSTDTAVAYIQQIPELAQTLESLVGRYIAVRAAQQSFRADWNVNLIVPADVIVAEGGPAAASQPADVATVGDEPAPAAVASQPAADAEDK